MRTLNMQPVANLMHGCCMLVPRLITSTLLQVVDTLENKLIFNIDLPARCIGRQAFKNQIASNLIFTELVQG